MSSSTPITLKAHLHFSCLLPEQSSSVTGFRLSMMVRIPEGHQLDPRPVDVSTTGAKADKLVLSYHLKQNKSDYVLGHIAHVLYSFKPDELVNIKRIAVRIGTSIQKLPIPKSKNLTVGTNMVKTTNAVMQVLPDASSGPELQILSKVIPHVNSQQLDEQLTDPPGVHPFYNYSVSIMVPIPENTEFNSITPGIGDLNTAHTIIAVHVDVVEGTGYEIINRVLTVNDQYHMKTISTKVIVGDPQVSGSSMLDYEDEEDKK